MKCEDDVVYVEEFSVAPLAGAWIEIPGMIDHLSVLTVAPLAGAWIEIYRNGSSSSDIFVAPLAGAWIEICKPVVHAFHFCRRSPRGSVD